LFAAAATYFALALTVFAPVDQHGAKLSHLTIESRAVGEGLGVSVIVPGGPQPERKRPLLVFLHGRGGSDASGTQNEAIYNGLARLGRRAPVIAFPDGGDHSYWHNRKDGRWGTYVMREVIPTVAREFGTDPRRVAIGGISMGGFGAYDLALLHPRRFCAVGGHSAALWFESGETAPGAFDDAVDFERNDVVGAVRADPNAFGSMRIWNDYGSEDPFRGYNEGFVDYLEAGNADLSAHTWPGGHEGSYWNRHFPAYLRFYANSLAHC
jgi:S-formylglutathione hydrolase FrmB